MGVRYVCDGCQRLLKADDQVETVGLIRKRDYCSKCARIAKNYLAALDKAHTEIADQWAEKLRGYRREYRKQIRVLPDAPDSGDA